MILITIGNTSRKLNCYFCSIIQTKHASRKCKNYLYRLFRLSLLFWHFQKFEHLNIFLNSGVFLNKGFFHKYLRYETNNSVEDLIFFLNFRYFCFNILFYFVIGFGYDDYITHAITLFFFNYPDNFTDFAILISIQQ